MATTIALKGRKVKKEPIAYNELAIRHNTAMLDYVRTSASALSGAAAGILGLTGLYGFVFYFIASFIVSVLLLLKAGSQWSKFFRSWTGLVTSGLFGGIFTYIVFWTFLYGMVHVY